MKPAARELERFCAQLPAAIQAVLLYGPDQGLVMERRRVVLAQWVDDPSDAMAVTQLAADTVRQDPARLADETLAFSMLSGRRAVRLTDAGDAVTAAIKPVLDLDRLEAPLLVEARDLPASSSLRKLFEKPANAAAIPCYRAEGRDLETLVRAKLEGFGLRCDPEALDHLVAHVGSDRAVLSRELEKLDLYLGERRDVALADAVACVGDSSALDVDALVEATATGAAARAAELLERLLAARETPVGIIRRLAGHHRRLWALAIEVEAGQPIDAVLENARPRIFFRAKPGFKRALERRSARRWRDAVAVLVAAERQCKTSGLPAELLCRRVVLRLAAGR